MEIWYNVLHALKKTNYSFFRSACSGLMPHSMLWVQTAIMIQEEDLRE